MSTNHWAFTILFDFITAGDHFPTCLRYTFLHPPASDGQAHHTPKRRVLTCPLGLGGSRVSGEAMSRRHDCRVGNSKSCVTPNVTLTSPCQHPRPDGAVSVTSCHLCCWS